MSYQKFVKNIGIVYFINLAMALRGIFLLPIITKFLGVESYGIWAQLTVLITLVSPLITLGLPYSLVRFLAGEQDKNQIKKQVYSVLFFLTLVNFAVAALIYAGAGAIGAALGFEPVLIRMISIAIFFESLNSVLLNVFRAFQKISTYSFFIILQGLGEIAITISMIAAGKGLAGAITALALIRIITFLLAGLMVARHIGLAVPSLQVEKKLFAFGLPTLPNNLSTWFMKFNDRYLIGFFLGAVSVGQYVPAFVLGSVISFFEAPFSFLLPPALSKHHDQNESVIVKTFLRYSLKYYLMITIPSLFGLTVLSKKLLILLSNSEIAEASYLIVPLISGGMLFYGLSNIVSQVLILSKKTYILGKTWSFIALANFLLNLFLIPFLGIKGAGISSLISFFMLFVFMAFYSSKDITVDYDWLFVSKSLASSAVMALFVFFANPTGLFQIIGIIFVAALFYGMLLYLFGGINKSELSFAISFFRPGKKP